MDMQLTLEPGELQILFLSFNLDRRVYIIFMASVYRYW